MTSNCTGAGDPIARSQNIRDEERGAFRAIPRVFLHDDIQHGLRPFLRVKFFATKRPPSTALRIAWAKPKRRSGDSDTLASLSDFLRRLDLETRRIISVSSGACQSGTELATNLDVTCCLHDLEIP